MDRYAPSIRRVSSSFDPVPEFAEQTLAIVDKVCSGEVAMGVKRACMKEATSAASTFPVCFKERPTEKSEKTEKLHRPNLNLFAVCLFWWMIT